MTKLVKLETISLKDHSEINEKCIQKFIFENPAALGLGNDLTPLSREKKQQHGGYLDLLFADDNNTHYEVEIQLGATDPSHIIRTIEYWDKERKLSPQYDHCAVIVAEKITGRFQNIISLFNGQIPLIALQMTASQIGNDIHISFIKILDRNVTEEEEKYEPTDLAYWEIKSSPNILKQIHQIFENLNTPANYKLNYTKGYIGSNKEGISRNFIYFKPKKEHLYLFIEGDRDQDKIKQLENAGLDISLHKKHYRIRLQGFEEYKKHKTLIDELVTESLKFA